MSFDDPRTEVGLKLVNAANHARLGSLRQRDIDDLRVFCADAVPTDDTVLSAVDGFALGLHEDAATAASQLTQFVRAWWRKEFPNDYEIPQLHAWQVRADTGVE